MTNLEMPWRLLSRADGQPLRDCQELKTVTTDSGFANAILPDGQTRGPFRLDEVWIEQRVDGRWHRIAR
jgi:hypothetical protein